MGVKGGVKGEVVRVEVDKAAGKVHHVPDLASGEGAEGQLGFEIKEALVRFPRAAASTAGTERRLSRPSTAVVP